MKSSRLRQNLRNSKKRRANEDTLLNNKMSLEEAYNRIAELEKECNEQRQKQEKYQTMAPVGRHKHDAKWQK